MCGTWKVIFSKCKLLEYLELYLHLSRLYSPNGCGLGPPMQRGKKLLWIPGITIIGMWCLNTWAEFVLAQETGIIKVGTFK